MGLDYFYRLGAEGVASPTPNFAKTLLAEQE